MPESLSSRLEATRAHSPASSLPAAAAAVASAGVPLLAAAALAAFELRTSRSTGRARSCHSVGASPHPPLSGPAHSLRM